MCLLGLKCSTNAYEVQIKKLDETFGSIYRRLHSAISLCVLLATLLEQQEGVDLRVRAFWEP